MNVSYRTLELIADRANLNERRSLDSVIHTDYSGRGMYGRTCIGFSLDDDSQMLDLGAALAEIADEPFGTARTDGMGRGIIVYWPRVQCDDAPEEGDID